MAIPVIMPRQGQSVETCIITQWLKKKGDKVEKGDILFSYETDKAAFDAEAEESGILLELFFDEGDEVPVLVNVAVIGNEGESVNEFRPESSETGEAATAPVEQVIEEKSVVAPVVEAESHSNEPGKKIRISPRAKVLAASMNIAVQNIKGTGPNGRIIFRDVEAYSKQSASKVVAVAAPEKKEVTYTTQTVTKEYKVPANLKFEEKKLSNIRKIISKTMHESISQSAQLTHHLSADVRKLLALRKQFKAEASQGSKQNITLNDMICYAVIRALEKFPEANSHFVGDSTRTFEKVHLGLAVDTPRGLMVPSLQNASDLSLKGLSSSLFEIADQCRQGNVNPELLSSTAASFTVSNLGNYGVEMFTPIINLPQVAILGVNTITYRPMDTGDGIIGFVPVIGLSLTYDHRAIDGGPATLFLKEIKNQIEDFKVFN